MCAPAQAKNGAKLVFPKEIDSLVSKIKAEEKEEKGKAEAARRQLAEDSITVDLVTSMQEPGGAALSLKRLGQKLSPKVYVIDFKQGDDSNGRCPGHLHLHLRRSAPPCLHTRTRK